MLSQNRKRLLGGRKISSGWEKRLDFSKPFMPESLAQVKELSFLSPEEQCTLNQIRGA